MIRNKLAWFNKKQETKSAREATKPSLEKVVDRSERPEADILKMKASEFRIRNEGQYSDHINLIGHQAAFSAIKEFAAPGKSFIDIGGRSGERKALATGYRYVVMDIARPVSVEDFDFIEGDITHCPEVASDQYDVTFSMNLLEHVKNPFAAAAEMVRLTAPGGLIVAIAPFAWRYHPFPGDYWRFTHTGLERLFLDAGAETELTGYDASLRRKNHKGGQVPPNLDVPPIDELGGWREHWHAIYLGKKPT